MWNTTCLLPGNNLILYSVQVDGKIQNNLKTTSLNLQTVAKSKTQLALAVTKDIYNNDGLRGFYRFAAFLFTCLPSSALWWTFYHLYQGLHNINLGGMQHLCSLMYLVQPYGGHFIIFIKVCITLIN